LPLLKRTILWQRLDRPGMEYFGLWSQDDGWQLRGTVVVSLDDLPAQVRYGVICNECWETRAAHLALRSGAPEQALHLAVDERRRWTVNGAETPALEGCVDVDIELTPSTNTLPIRRLQLAQGETRAVRAGWIHFPDLTVEVLAQTYTRLSEFVYRYESDDGRFSRELEVDELGLVVRYPGLWERVAEA
jgi:hypothetical protein